jgi:hypothetical protein
MFLIGLGALLVLGGILYVARAAIWRGALSGPDSSGRFATLWSRHGRGVRFLGLGTNWPGVGGQFLATWAAVALPMTAIH